MTNLIDRNTTIPTRESKIFSTDTDNQTTFDIKVLEGEMAMSCDNVTLSRFNLVGIPPAKRGIPQIEVTFGIDANGILHVAAKDFGTGKEQKMTITPLLKMGSDEIDRNIQNTEKYAEDYREDKEKQREADLLRKSQDAQREKERQVRQREEAARMQREKEDKPARIEHGEKSSGGKWFFGVIIILAVLALGWYGTQGSNNPQVSVNPATAAALVTSSADQKTITNSIGMEFVQIPAGEFDMGSPANENDRFDNEGPVHRVKISNAFYMGKFEVTQKQWRDVMGTSPSNFKGDDLPVEQVSWNDVQEFIKKLNDKEGGNKYRLPSEAEWEYAARAGTTTRYSFGDDVSKLGDYAWYSENSGSKTHEVGQKSPIHGDFMTCMATSGNGFRIYIKGAITAHPQTAVHGKEVARPELFAAAAGTTTTGTAGQRIATTTSAFAF
jgi:formylglycine-generating enzyme required for sulfatase activity